MISVLNFLMNMKKIIKKYIKQIFKSTFCVIIKNNLKGGGFMAKKNFYYLPFNPVMPQAYSYSERKKLRELKSIKL